MCTALIASIRCAASRFAGANGESGQGRPESGPEIGTVFRPQEGDRIRKFNRIRDRIPGSKKPGQPSAVGPFLARPRPFVSNSPLRRWRRGYSSKSLKELGRHCGSAQSWKQLIGHPRRTKQMREHQ